MCKFSTHCIGQLDDQTSPEMVSVGFDKPSTDGAITGWMDGRYRAPMVLIIVLLKVKLKTQMSTVKILLTMQIVLSV